MESFEIPDNNILPKEEGKKKFHAMKAKYIKGGNVCGV